MGQYTSYYLYQKFVKYGSQDWLPAYPNEYSISGDGTNPLVVKSENDVECGYIPPSQPIYRWVNLPISTDYICDETSKFYKQKRQVSYDSGTTWQDVVPYEYQKGNLYELNSPDCGYEQLERWVNSGTTCSGASGYDKYYLQVKQTSTDGGTTWTTTSDTRLGTLIEANSTDCGYVSTTKFKATYSNSRTYSAECNSNTTLTSGETRPNGYAFSSMTEAEIGDCVTNIGTDAFKNCSGLTNVSIGSGVTSIGECAFYECSSLSSVTIPSGVTSIGYDAFTFCNSLRRITIPNSVTSIGTGAFSDCSCLTSVTIGSGVTSIGGYAFYNCRNLTSVNIPNSVTIINSMVFYKCSRLSSITIPSGVTSIGSESFWNCSGLTNITVEATTPPTLGDYAFNYTNNCPIYVPSGSVNAYKSASGWSTYASRIQAIP